LLVRAGADIEATDVAGRTPLIEAAYLGQSDTVQFLINVGADIETRDTKGRTALAVAVTLPRR